MVLPLLSSDFLQAQVHLVPVHHINFIASWFVCIFLFCSISVNSHLSICWGSSKMKLIVILWFIVPARHVLYREVPRESLMYHPAGSKGWWLDIREVREFTQLAQDVIP